MGCRRACRRSEGAYVEIIDSRYNFTVLQATLSEVQNFGIKKSRCPNAAICSCSVILFQSYVRGNRARWWRSGRGASQRSEATRSSLRSQGIDVRQYFGRLSGFHAAMGRLADWAVYMKVGQSVVLTVASIHVAPPAQHHCYCLS